MAGSRICRQCLRTGQYWLSRRRCGHRREEGLHNVRVPLGANAVAEDRLGFGERECLA